MVTDSVEKVRKMRDEQHKRASEIDKDISTLRGALNFEGVLCRWPQCVRTISRWDCPYLHSYNPIQALQCPLGSQCWRLEVCPLQHTVRSSVEIRSANVWGGLVNEGGLHDLLAKRGAAGCKFEVSYTHDPARVQTRWLFFVPGGASAELFDPESTARLEATWQQQQSSTCPLANGSTAYFSHMISIFPTGQYHFLARLDTLEAYKPSATLTFECPPQSLQAVLSDIAGMEVSADLPVRLCAADMQSIVNYYQVAVEDGKVYGSPAAVQRALDAINSDPMQIFTFIAHCTVPDSVYLPGLTEDVHANRVLIVGRHAYGSQMDIEDLQLVWGRYEYTADCPMDVDELNLVMVCSELGVTVANGKLIGGEKEVRLALDQLNCTTVMIPGELTEEEIGILMSLFPISIVGNTFQGSKENVEKALLHVKKLEIEADFPVDLPFEVVQKAVTNYQVRLQGTKIVGMKESVERAVRFLTDQKKPEEGKMGFEFHILPEWYLNIDMNVYVEDLLPTSPGYEEASSHFYKTMKGQGTVQHVYMIVNKKLYTNFAYKHESKSKVEGRTLEIMLLFHGTRATNPQVIYESEEGLDSRLGGGMWGNGTYYAKNASYSNAYAYHNGQGSMQMFLCEVIVGDYVTLGPQALVKPPQKKKSTGSYHSVKGNASGSDIWITYEVSMSYPKYLIDYRPGG